MGINKDNEMKEQLIKYDTAKLAKEKGFKSVGTPYYSHNGVLTTNDYNAQIIQNFDLGVPFERTHAVSQSIIQKWLREKHNIHVDVYRNAMGWQCNLDKADNGTFICEVEEYNEDNEYEDALEQGLQYALKNHIKQ